MKIPLRRARNRTKDTVLSLKVNRCLPYGYSYNRFYNTSQRELLKVQEVIGYIGKEANNYTPDLG